MLTSNVLTSNVLTSNVLTSNVLTSNMLTSNILTSNVLICFQHTKLHFYCNLPFDSIITKLTCSSNEIV